MSPPRYDWRDLAASAHQLIEHEPEEIVLREAMRLHSIGRTTADIGLLLGLDPADVHVLIYGLDEPGAVA